MDLLNIVLGVFTVASIFAGGGWAFARSINGSIERLRLEIKGNMIQLEGRVTKKIENDMNHLEKNLTQKIEASK